jgi:hypothetical protein
MEIKQLFAERLEEDEKQRLSGDGGRKSER